MNRAQVEALARTLLDENGLHDWRIGWRNLRATAGQTWYDGKKLIEFSVPYFAVVPEERQLDTIRHEVAHAVLLSEKPTEIPQVQWAGEDGHSPRWQMLAAAIGASPAPMLVLDDSTKTRIKIAGSMPTTAVATFLNTAVDTIALDWYVTERVDTTAPSAL